MDGFRTRNRRIGEDRETTAKWKRAKVALSRNEQLSCRCQRQEEAIGAVRKRQKSEVGVKATRLIIDRVNDQRVDRDLAGDAPLQRVEKENSSQTPPLALCGNRQPAQQDSRYGRVSRKLLAKRLGKLVHRDPAGGQGVEADHIPVGASGRETSGDAPSNILAHLLDEVPVQRGTPRTKILAGDSRIQRLDAEGQSPSTICLCRAAARRRASFGSGGWSKASANAHWSSRDNSTTWLCSMALDAASRTTETTKSVKLRPWSWAACLIWRRRSGVIRASSRALAAETVIPEMYGILPKKANREVFQFRSSTEMSFYKLCTVIR